MPTPDPEQSEQDDLAERDRATVLGCEHAAIQLDQDTLQYLHGPAYVDIITCATCPTEVVLVTTADPRDDMYARLPLGN